MLTPFQHVCAVLIGAPPQAISPEELETRMRTEIIRLSINAGVFLNKPELLAAYKSGDAVALSKASLIPLPVEPEPVVVTLDVLNAKLDMILARIG